MDELDDALELVASAACEAGIQVSPQCQTALGDAATWLASLARSSGLSGYRTPAEALLRGMAPAIAFFRVFPDVVQAHIADVGAGNGALGAAIAILRENLTVTLVDRATRAYTACEILAARLRLPNLSALKADAATLPPESVDGAVFRALADSTAALAVVRPIVRNGGLLGAFHQADDDRYTGAVGDLILVGSEPTIVPSLTFTGYRT